MLETFVKAQGIYYLIIALCLIGIIGKVYESRVYKKLLNVAGNPEKADHSFIKQLKVKYKSYYMVNRKIRNIDTFIELNIMRYKRFGIGMEKLRTFHNRIMLLCIMASSVGVVLCSRYQMGDMAMMYHMLAGVLAAAAMEWIDLQFGNEKKRRFLFVTLKDYLENVLTNQLEHTEQNRSRMERNLAGTQAKELEERRKEADNQVAAARQQSPKVDQHEREKRKKREQNLAQEKVIAEVIKEFFP